MVFFQVLRVFVFQVAMPAGVRVLRLVVLCLRPSPPDDIKAHKKPETAHILRFRLKRTSYGRILNPRTISHLFASNLLMCNQGLGDSFIRVSQVNSLYGQSYPDSHWDVGGSQLVELRISVL